MPPENTLPSKVTWIEPKSGVFTAYANYVNALWTPHDIKLKFGELSKIMESGTNREFIVEEWADITLAWSEAKMLLTMLADIIARYEALNGEIKTPQVP
jgi:hypothetical protein